MKQQPWLDQSLAPDGRRVCDNFTRWFDKSSIVGADGTPLVGYHGTDNDFDRFDPHKASRLDMGWFGGGDYFTLQVHEASQYAGVRGGGGVVMPVYLSIQHPYRVEATRPASSAMRLQFIQEFGKDAFDEVVGGDSNPYLGFLHNVNAWLAQRGFDGVIAQYNGVMEEIVAFEPWQIKSAIGNSGLFLREGLTVTDHAEAQRMLRARAAATVFQASCEPRVAP